jgi:hypothetical protein
MASEIVSIPGIDDLLVPATTADDPKLVADAAANVLEPLAKGIGAIGELMFWSAQHPDFDMQRDVVRKTGELLELLAKLQHGVLCQYANGRDEERQREARGVEA